MTSGILYLTLSAHHRNRSRQATILRQQSLLLTNIVEPFPIPPPPTSREARLNWTETAKDRWNGEIESFVRRVQTTDWNVVRERWEDRIVGVWRAAANRVKEEGKGGQ